MSQASESPQGKEVSPEEVDSFLKNANKLLSQIPIRLKDEVYTLEYTMYSLIRLDEDCKINLFDPETLASLFPGVVEQARLAQEGKASQASVGAALFKNLTPRFICQLIWAGLVSNEKNEAMTVDQVARKFNAMSFVQQLIAFSGVQKGIDAAMPSDKEEKKSSSQNPIKAEAPEQDQSPKP